MEKRGVASIVEQFWELCRTIIQSGKSDIEQSWELEQLLSEREATVGQSCECEPVLGGRRGDSNSEN